MYYVAVEYSPKNEADIERMDKVFEDLVHKYDGIMDGAGMFVACKQPIRDMDAEFDRLNKRQRLTIRRQLKKAGFKVSIVREEECDD